MKLAVRAYKKNIYQVILSLKETARQVDQRRPRSRRFRFSVLQEGSPPGRVQPEAPILRDMLYRPDQNEGALDDV